MSHDEVYAELLGRGYTPERARLIAAKAAQLQEARGRFNSVLHPRDRLQRFRDVAGKGDDAPRAVRSGVIGPEQRRAAAAKRAAAPRDAYAEREANIRARHAGAIPATASAKEPPRERDAWDRAARGVKGKVRNFGAMGDDKFRMEASRALNDKALDVAELKAIHASALKRDMPDLQRATSELLDSSVNADLQAKTARAAQVSDAAQAGARDRPNAPGGDARPKRLVTPVKPSAEDTGFRPSQLTSAERDFLDEVGHDQYQKYLGVAGVADGPHHDELVDELRYAVQDANPANPRSAQVQKSLLAKLDHALVAAKKPDKKQGARDYKAMTDTVFVAEARKALADPDVTSADLEAIKRVAVERGLPHIAERAGWFADDAAAKPSEKKAPGDLSDAELKAELAERAKPLGGKKSSQHEALLARSRRRQAIVAERDKRAAAGGGAPSSATPKAGAERLRPGQSGLPHGAEPGRAQVVGPRTTRPLGVDAPVDKRAEILRGDAERKAARAKSGVIGPEARRARAAELASADERTRLVKVAQREAEIKAQRAADQPEGFGATAWTAADYETPRADDGRATRADPKGSARDRMLADRMRERAETRIAKLDSNLASALLAEKASTGPDQKATNRVAKKRVASLLAQREEALRRYVAAGGEKDMTIGTLGRSGSEAQERVMGKPTLEVPRRGSDAQERVTPSGAPTAAEVGRSERAEKFYADHPYAVPEQRKGEERLAAAVKRDKEGPSWTAERAENEARAREGRPPTKPEGKPHELRPEEKKELDDWVERGSPGGDMPELAKARRGEPNDRDFEGALSAGNGIVASGVDEDLQNDILKALEREDSVLVQFPRKTVRVHGDDLEELDADQQLAWLRLESGELEGDEVQRTGESDTEHRERVMTRPEFRGEMNFGDDEEDAQTARNDEERAAVAGRLETSEDDQARAESRGKRAAERDAAADAMRRRDAAEERQYEATLAASQRRDAKAERDEEAARAARGRPKVGGPRSTNRDEHPLDRASSPEEMAKLDPDSSEYRRLAAYRARKDELDALKAEFDAEFAGSEYQADHDVMDASRRGDAERDADPSTWANSEANRAAAREREAERADAQTAKNDAERAVSAGPAESEDDVARRREREYELADTERRREQETRAQRDREANEEGAARARDQREAAARVEAERTAAENDRAQVRARERVAKQDAAAAKEEKEKAARETQRAASAAEAQARQREYVQRRAAEVAAEEEARAAARAAAAKRAADAATAKAEAAKKQQAAREQDAKRAVGYQDREGKMVRDEDTRAGRGPTGRVRNFNAMGDEKFEREAAEALRAHSPSAAEAEAILVSALKRGNTRIADDAADLIVNLGGPSGSLREATVEGLVEATLHRLMEGSSASLDRSPKKNWVEKSGGLPRYVREVARAIHEKRGVPLDKAIQIAIGTLKRWAAGGDDVSAATQAKAAKAVAQWEALKGRNAARTAAKA